MRIQRALARAGIASRRAADALVAEGRVQVNGAVAQVGQVVDPERDVILVDGRRLPAAPRTTWIALHKPVGVVTTRRDPRGRRTVFDLVPDVRGLTYVGRLDYLTEGLLLLTTEGEAAHALTHPSRGVEREYRVEVRGDAEAALDALRAGVVLEDGLARIARGEAAPHGRGRWTLTLVLAEGRNREVRRLCAETGLTVERLVRTRYGPVTLGKLAVGESRPLTPAERTAISQLVARSAAPGVTARRPRPPRRPR
jgi:23S rRNA pseudouridine2605 synthase